MGFYLVRVLIFLSFAFSGDANHLIFNRVCIAPDEGQMIEIYNPSDDVIDLSNHYLSDTNEYYNWVHGNSSIASSRDFIIQFNQNTKIEPQGSIYITTQSNDVFFTYYGYYPDISLIDTDFANAEIGGSAELSGSQEMLVLFYWDQVSNIIKDVDYFLWGASSTAVSKTVAEGYPYNDTDIDQQHYIRNYGVPQLYGPDTLYVRNSIDETGETQNEGNGITGHDETSEDFTLSWSLEPYWSGVPFEAIIEGDYDCGESSFDACPLGGLSCNLITTIGVIVSYKKSTTSPHVVTIEDENGLRLEAITFDWDIPNDSASSYLLAAPYKRFLVAVHSYVFEYNDNKQLYLCDSNSIEVIESYDMDGIFSNSYINSEPYDDLNNNGQWDAGFCADENLLTEESCEAEGFQWTNEEPYSDLNNNGQWDAEYEEYYNFDKASINPAPYVLLASHNERLDYSYSFPSNSRVVIRVVDISGRFITTLADQYYPSSGVVTREEYTSSWDGKDHFGQILSPGTYLMHIEASNFQTGKTTSDIAPVVIGVKK